ncbi:MAG TPA: glycosyltransferase [Kiritimatiellia bacterium]|nr:glycosyltransferase [Kiritimatiellia bacterium]
MTKEPLLTVVVPTYNAAKDLPTCLEKLYAQTRPIRILIADDGSTDATAQIADEAAAAHPEVVRVAHFPHVGATSARKAAVPSVSTPYLAFLDADDALETTFAETMLEVAERQDADMVFCPYVCVYDGIARHVSYEGDGAAFARDVHPIRKTPSLLLTVPVFFWGKLFRTDYFLAHCDFASEDSASLADVPTILPLLIDMPRIAKVAEPLYRYSISSNSMCRVSKQELIRLAAMRTLHRRLEAMGALPAFLPQLHAINRCYLFDQLEKLGGYCDPVHQHRVVREYFRHLDGTLPHWRPHPFHPTFYAAYWHGVVTWNAAKTWWRARGRKQK